MDTNKKYKIRFTKECKREMDNIYQYISRKLYSPNSAKELMRMVEKSIYNLKEMPEIHGIIKQHDDLDLQYRKIVVKNYIIIYTILEEHKTVSIVHMYYGKSNYIYNL